MSVEKSELGKSTVYDTDYDPGLLFPIRRSDSRQSLDLPEEMFIGEDLWTCFELSWLLPSGLPAAALANFRIPCQSPNIIESKSFKLYLNSLNFKVFENEAALKQCLVTDLSQAAGAGVSVELRALDMQGGGEIADLSEWPLLESLSLDNATAFSYTPDAKLLQLTHDHTETGKVTRQWCSHLLRSNCPVTNQPDWGSVFIRYEGPEIQAESLLRYIVSFRQCQDFHEHCVERMYADIMQHCACDSLSVYARYTRRGGLDINPLRSTEPDPIPGPRQIRQ